MVTSKEYVVGARLPPSGIFVKPSAGAWQHAGYSHPFINALDFDPREPDTVYVAAGNGLLRVQDRGEHWKILTGSDVTELPDVAVWTAMLPAPSTSRTPPVFSICWPAPSSRRES